MKTAVKLLTVTLGVMLVLSTGGCPKKNVVTSEELVTPPPPPDTIGETLPTTPKVELKLATIHFDFDKSDIRPGDATLLQDNYDELQMVIAANQRPAVTIEGYCDPIGTSEYNMALGMRRAQSARDYLVKLGADMNMFSIVSFGEEKLVTEEPAQFELNRRCEFKVAQ